MTVQDDPTAAFLFFFLFCLLDELINCVRWLRFNTRDAECFGSLVSEQKIAV